MSAVSHSKIYSQNETANTNNVLSIRQKDNHRQRQPAIFPKLYEISSRPDRKQAGSIMILMHTKEEKAKIITCKVCVKIRKEDNYEKEKIS